MNYTRKEAIAAMHQHNLSVQTIAARLGLSHGYVRNVIAELPKVQAKAWNNCLRCLHAWPKRPEVLPDRCPKCRSMLWQKPRQRKYTKPAPQIGVKRPYKAPTPDPTPEEIQAACAAIREKWSDYDRRQRYRLPKAEPWHPQVIDTSAVGFALSDAEGSPTDQDRRAK